MVDTTTSKDASEPWPNRLWLGFLGNGREIFTFLAGISGALWGTHEDQPFDSASAIWLSIALFISLLIVLLFHILQPSYGKLATDLRETRSKYERRGEAVERALSYLLQEIGKELGVETTKDRISVYYYTKNHFVMIARHSRNPEYDKPGRRRYPSNHGAIGKGWNETFGTALLELPARPETWVKRMVEHHGVSEAQAENMRMKSREIGSIRLEGDRTSVGMLVIESMDKERISQQTLDQAQESALFETICKFVDFYAPDTPRAEKLIEDQTTDEAVPWKATKTSPNLTYVDQSFESQ